MDFLKKLLSDTGAVSTMRVMSIASFIVGSIIAIYGVAKGKDLSGLAQVCGVFVGSAFAGKAVSKFAERTNENL